MPIYEYRCDECAKEFNILFLNHRASNNVLCRFCSSPRVTRLLSFFRVHQSEEAKLSGFDSRVPRGDDFYKDSRNVGLWAKKRMRELGVDLGPQLDEIVEKGRTGKILDESDK